VFAPHHIGPDKRFPAFLFFVRDNVTGVLLFAGAEMNPTTN